MRLENLKLGNFRNYQQLEMSFDNPINIFIGQNGQGKTNLLESIALAVGGLPFRAVDPEQFVLKGQKDARIHASLESGGSTDQVKVQLTQDKKQFLLNEKKISRTVLWKKFGAVAFSPESLKVVKSGPSERRSMIDEMIVSSDPQLWSLYASYQRCVKQRNFLLKAFRNNSASKEERVVLENLTETLLKTGAQIAFMRIQFLRKMTPNFKRHFSHIIDNQNVDIAVDYSISEQSAIAWDENQVYDALRSRQKELAQAEISLGQSLVGPHKHDLIFLYQNEDARFFCSQGQQRSIVLAAKIAHIEIFRDRRGHTPLLLLDDVLSELDETRRRKLIEVLVKLETTIYLTTTEIENCRDFDSKSISTFRIASGVVKKEGWK
ncbi:MAG: DNA replication and repair protein RecF [Bdellovibrionota bacterium]|mgnify:CR=1 FL=1